MNEPQAMELVLYPDPFLNQVMRPVTEAELKAGQAGEWNLPELVERMKVTMYANEGVGLAAPQVRVGLRLFVIDVSKDKTGFREIFNPVLENLAGSDLDEEGCLSIPEVRGKVKRAKALTCTGVDLHGQPVSFDCRDLLARACQHETDHLDGILFIAKLGMTARYSARKRLDDLEADYRDKQAAAKKKAKK
ncbi:MAG: peptide deformylase [Planctomycetota bacterium]